MSGLEERSSGWLALTPWVLVVALTATACAGPDINNARLLPEVPEHPAILERLEGREQHDGWTAYVVRFTSSLDALEWATSSHAFLGLALDGRAIDGFVPNNRRPEWFITGPWIDVSPGSAWLDHVDFFADDELPFVALIVVRPSALADVLSGRFDAELSIRMLWTGKLYRYTSNWTPVQIRP